jgi:hypothetical protein
MIDAGDVSPINRNFIENLRKLILEHRFRLKVSFRLVIPDFPGNLPSIL